MASFWLTVMSIVNFVTPPKICPVCRLPMPANRPKQAKYCVPCSAERKRAWMRAYNKRPDVKARNSLREKSPTRKKNRVEWDRLWWQNEAWDNSDAYQKRLADKRRQWTENREKYNKTRRAKWAAQTAKFEALKERAADSQREAKWRPFIVPDYLK